MTVVLLWGFGFGFGFGCGWIAHDVRCASRRASRRGGYVRRVPMASVHPREPKS